MRCARSLEKRKVGGSTPPLPTPLTSTNAQARDHDRAIDAGDDASREPRRGGPSLREAWGNGYLTAVTVVMLISPAIPPSCSARVA
jgi:hypothetical protein